MLRKRLQLTWISLCFRNRLPESSSVGVTDSPPVGGAAFTVIIFSMMICFLWSFDSGTLVRYAQVRTLQCVFWSFRCSRRVSPGSENLLHKRECALNLRQRIAPN